MVDAENLRLDLMEALFSVRDFSVYARNLSLQPEPYENLSKIVPDVFFGRRKKCDASSQPRPKDRTNDLIIIY